MGQTCNLREIRSGMCWILPSLDRRLRICWSTVLVGKLLVLPQTLIVWKSSSLMAY